MAPEPGEPNWLLEIDQQVAVAKQNDKFDEGVVDIRGEAIAMAEGYPAVLATDHATGVKLMHHKLDVDRGISYDRAAEILAAKAASNPEGKLLNGEGFGPFGQKDGAYVGGTPAIPRL